MVYSDQPYVGAYDSNEEHDDETLDEPEVETVGGAQVVQGRQVYAPRELLHYFGSPATLTLLPLFYHSTHLAHHH